MGDWEKEKEKEKVVKMDGWEKETEKDKGRRKEGRGGERLEESVGKRGRVEEEEG